MISVDLVTFIVVYLSILLVPVFAAWLLNEHRRQQRERGAFRHVVRCSLCAFEFEDRSDESLPRCPRCGGLNERSTGLRL